MAPDAEPKARRSRLTEERERELYEAVIELLREAGYDALTMDAIAARTHSSKATLYRQWNGKPELVAAALRSCRPITAADVDTGTLRGDLRELLRLRCATSLRDASLMRALGQAMHKDPDLLRAFRTLVVEPETAALAAMLDRGVRRGELAADCPAAPFVPHMVLGALAARPLLEGAEADAEYLARYVDAVVLPALGL
ncbi:MULTISPECIES: TetR/AcrR family transcriptional regulator [Kitasatospora]|uniref:TetR/AcrR family transcriptional regulator n=1 Tax=Kitasatospora arboriphila TaxID=258052 RepID=A0ABN1TXG5_9ACTN